MKGEVGFDAAEDGVDDGVDEADDSDVSAKWLWPGDGRCEEDREADEVDDEDDSEWRREDDSEDDDDCSSAFCSGGM